MNYNDFKKQCDLRHLQVNDITRHIHMTYQGLKAGLNTGKLGSNKVLEICKLLRITPNEFFGLDQIDPARDGEVSSLYTLQEQLAIKDKQIAELHALLAKK